MTTARTADFFCGQFRAKCPFTPQKKTAVRAVVMALDPEERALFADELHGMKESDFETTDAQSPEASEAEDVLGFQRDQK